MTRSGQDASWVVGRPSRMSESSWEAHLDVQEWSGGHHGWL